MNILDEITKKAEDFKATTTSEPTQCSIPRRKSRELLKLEFKDLTTACGDDPLAARKLAEAAFTGGPAAFNNMRICGLKISISEAPEIVIS